MASRKAHQPSSNPMQSFKDWEIACSKSRQKSREHISSIGCCRRGYSRPNKCWTATKGGNYSVIHWSNGRLGALRKYFWIFSSAGDNFPLQAIGGPSQFYPLWQLWITPNNKNLLETHSAPMEIIHFASKAAKIGKSAIASLSQRISHHKKTRKYYLQQIWLSYQC